MLSTKKEKSLINSFPETFGVYQMFNDKGEIIYIGKANNLKKRIQSYFQKKKNQEIKTKKLVENIHDIKCIEVNSELEALILETNLIKENRPKYNILMKDDKNYAYIKITNEDFPQICIVRKRLKDDAKYFGPKTNARSIKETLRLINKIFKYRACNLKIEEKDNTVKITGHTQKIPCLDYYINKCSGPCIGAIKKFEYQNTITQIIHLLEGKFKPITEYLRTLMIDAAQKKEFEKAAKIRDHIEQIKNISEKQLAADVHITYQDVIAFTEKDSNVYVNLFQIREGKIINQENFILTNENNNTVDEILSSFIKNYYTEASDIPEEILISDNISDKKILEEWLKKIASHKVKIITPIKGHKNNLIELSQKNAETFYKQSETSRKMEKPPKNNRLILQNIQKTLKLKNLPLRIECYDISHLSGTSTVGSMVVFENGEPIIQHYRKFNIKKLSEGQIDDYKALAEMLERRLSKLNSENAQYKNIHFRKAVKKELPFIKKMINKTNLDSENIHEKNFIIAETKNKIIGFGRMKKYEDETLELASLWIHEKERGEKIGWEIMKRLFKNFKGKNIYLSTRNFENYYENFGFRIIKKNIPICLIKKAKKFCKSLNKNEKKTIFMKFKIPQKEESFHRVPDLIIIDGGKGQLSSIENVIHTLRLDIDLISLAKKEEKIFIAGQSKPIQPDQNSESLYLLQRIRDEAHRFAHSFNQQLRNKKMKISELDAVSGVGPKIKKKLLHAFGSMQEIKKQSLQELIKICGDSTGKKIYESLK